MRPVELNDPPVYAPFSVRVLEAPAAPVEPGTVTVTCADAPTAMVPRFCGNGVAVAVPTLTAVRTTFPAAVPPVLETVSATLIIPPLRVSTLVTTRLAGAGAADTENVKDLLLTFPALSVALTTRVWEPEAGFTACPLVTDTPPSRIPDCTAIPEPLSVALQAMVRGVAIA